MTPPPVRFSEEASGVTGGGGEIHPPEAATLPRAATSGCGSVGGPCPRPAVREAQAQDGGNRHEEDLHGYSFLPLDVTALRRPHRTSPVTVHLKSKTCNLFH